MPIDADHEHVTTCVYMHTNVPNAYIHTDKCCELLAKVNINCAIV